MLNNIRIFLLVLAVLLPVSTFGQHDDPPEQAPDGDGTLVIPRTLKDQTQLPSPEAAQMNRYVDYPVSYSTGAMSVDVPLFSYSCGNLPVSASLSYHATGVKTEDDNCETGLGWSLFTGGCVSRSVLGRPDEMTKFDLKTAAEILSENDTEYLRSVLHLRTDANYDRYYYHFGKYSGSFILMDNEVYQLPETDLKIALIGDKKEGVMDFKITTPEGTEYYFTVREHIQYSYTSIQPSMLGGYMSPDYRAVCGWQLSRIINAQKSDTINIAYTSVSQSHKEETDRLKSTSFQVAHNTWKGDVQAQIGLSSIATSTYPDKCIPKEITCRTCRISFFNSLVKGTEYAHIDSINVMNSEGKCVRVITFNYSKFDDGRPSLDRVRVTSGGVLLDSRRFSYYPGNTTKDKDFFGYNNHDPLGPGRIDNSVLGYDGLLSDTRAYRFESAVGNSLKSITESTGAVTTLEYEPNECKKYRHTIDIGLRIKTVTVKDPLTQRQKVRSFSYENAASTIDFDRLEPSCFISTSGCVQPYANDTYSTGSTFTSSCRTPGASVENAVIYYGKVTETVSGTGMDHPVKTVYEYDISDIDQPYLCYGGCSVQPDIRDNVRYAGSKVYCLPYNDIDYITKRDRVYGPHYVPGYYQETCWEKAPLVHKTVYRYTDNEYEPEDEEFNYYSNDKSDPVKTGFHVELLTRIAKSLMYIEEQELLEKTSDANFFETELVRGRLFKDSTVLIHHYVNGVSRRIEMAYYYDGRSPAHSYYQGQIEIPSFPPDSLKPIGTIGSIILHRDSLIIDSITSSSLGLLRFVKVRCGGRTLDRSYCYASSINTPFYSKIYNTYGMSSLPVMEKTIVDKKDTLLLQHCYKSYGSETNIYPYQNRLSYNGTEISLQQFHDYDIRGNLLSTTVNHGSPTTYQWIYNQSLLGAVAKGGIYPSTFIGIRLPLQCCDTLLTTFYFYEPLIGCTRIRYPDNRADYFSYLGGRLSECKNSEKQPTISYGYTLWEEGRKNMTSKKVFTSPQKATGIESVCYYDGFGYPVNTVSKGITPFGEDLVTTTEYDAMNRKISDWLPVPMAGVTNLVTPSTQSTTAVTFYRDSDPVTHFDYGQSPDDFIQTTIPAGSDFKSHPVTQELMGCDPGKEELRCRRFKLVGGYAFSSDGVYPAGELEVLKTTDSDGHIKYTFTDFRGVKVLDRVFYGTGGHSFADTYYICDYLGNVRFVLPPAASSEIGEGATACDIRSDGTLRSYAYYYRYNRRLNCVEKKLPGADPVESIYDITGTPIFTQDGALRKLGKWRFSLPDHYERIVLTGLCTDPDSTEVGSRWVHVSQPDYPNASSTIAGSGYRANCKLSSAELLAASYYDNYDFSQMPAFSSLNVTPTSHMSLKTSQGLLTGTVTVVLPSGNRLYGVNYYDSEDRVISSCSTNNLGGTDEISTEYTFDGKLSKTTSVHRTVATVANRTADNIQTETRSYTYDPAGRLLKVISELNGRPVDFTFVDNAYDKLGRLKTDRRNGEPELCTSYDYNLYGWTTKISNPLFSEKLYYNESRGTNKPLYSGNVSAIDWAVNTLGGQQGKTRGYDFSYDGLSRLTAAKYYENGAASDHYNTSYTYDLMGNILSLKRNGLQDDGVYGAVDDLTYKYNGNQVVKVDDAVDGPYYKDAFHFVDGANEETEYEYDGNGNMTKDLNKKISQIEYNCLNLPQRISYQDGSRVLYTYDAGGVKLRTDYYINPLASSVPQVAGGSGSAGTTLKHTWTDYCGKFIYENDTITQVHFPGGYVTYRDTVDNMEMIDSLTTYTANVPVYHYYIQDHLGNNRVVLNEDFECGCSIEQINHYYPFGGLMGESRNLTSNQKYKYNGKELDRMHGLDWYDYGARNYDGMRFTTMDPLSEKYYNTSPYVYCENDPVLYIDINGDSLDMTAIAIQDKESKTNTMDLLNIDLSFITGLNLSVSDDGYMQYEKDENGEPVVNEKNSGSESAREFLIKMIDGPKIQVFLTADKSKTPNGGNQVGLNIKQIESFIKGATNIDGRTLGFGMTFLHELYHTGPGGSFNDFDNVKDNFGTGSVVPIMNKIRSELNEKKFNFGQRENYVSIFIDNNAYIPFDQKSLSSLKEGYSPSKGSKFIFYKVNDF